MVKEFVDKNRGDIMMKMHDLYDTGKVVNRKKFLALIEEDPYYLDPYVELYDRCLRNGDSDKAQKLLNIGYNKALELICDKKGDWPDVMEWGFLENRHVMRMLVNKGIDLWIKQKNDEALVLFRKLFRCCPNDNLGVRDYILAIRLNWTYSQFNEKLIDASGFYNNDALTNFHDKYDDFPDEFDWWKEEVGYE